MGTSWHRVWLLLAIALAALACACAGATASTTLDLRDWSFTCEGSTARAVSLPARLDDLLPARATRYTLQREVDLPPELREQELWLVLPQLAAIASLRVDGETAPPVADGGVEGRALDHRKSRPQHAFRIGRDRTRKTRIRLEIIVEHRWTVGGWFDGRPVLTSERDGSALFHKLLTVNGLGAYAALAALWPTGFTYLVLFLLDRRRREHGWFSLQALASSTLPLYGLGFTQRLFGGNEGVVLAVTQTLGVIAGIGFVREAFRLGRLPRVFLAMLAGVCIVAVAARGPFDAPRYLSPLVVTCILIAIGYILVTLGRLVRAGPTAASATLLLAAWSFIVLATIVDAPTWVGFGELFGGLRLATFSYATLGLAHVVVLSREHVLALGRADDLNEQLVARVALLEAREREIERLNHDLRREVEVRSRELADALARLVSTPNEDADLAPGTLVNGLYRIVRLVGEGGMGRVYEGARCEDERRIAIKVVRPGSGELALARLAREAWLATTVHHPSVVATFDVGVAEEGFLYIVMEYVAGAPLREHRARFGDVAWALPILRQIAEALAAIHAAGIVHRDLKPGNVLVLDAASEGADEVRVKLADFGVSTPFVRRSTMSGDRTGAGSEPRTLTAEPPVAGRAPDDASESTLEDARRASSSPELTAVGDIVGTPMYMAPELARGARRAEPSSDVFSFGVIAFILLTGRPPFAVAPAIAIMRGEASSLEAPSVLTIRPDVDERLSRVVDASLAIDPAARPSSGAVLDALARACQNAGPT